MRTSIFIIICFTLIFVLGNISISSQLTFPITGQYQRSLLPSQLNFIMICFVLLVLTTLFAVRTIGKRFSCKIKIVRKDLNLKNQYLIIGFWYFLVTIVVFVRTKGLGISAGYYEYYVAVLICVLIYSVVIKIRIRSMKPDAFAIIDSDILTMKLVGYKRQKMDRLQVVSHNPKNNSVTLGFKDGLENIELPMTDYEIEDIKEFIENIRKIKGDSIVVEECFLKDFPHTHKDAKNANA